MVTRGIIGTLQLAATVVFAIPLVYLGADFILQGRFLLGGGFLVIAALMIVVEEAVTTPRDVPFGAVKWLTSRALIDEEEEE